MSDYADNLRKSMIHTTRRFMGMVQEMQEKDGAALREQVIRMAREAGWQYADGDSGYEPLWRFAALVAAAEREACAKVCEEHGARAANWCAKAIRARGNT